MNNNFELMLAVAAAKSAEAEVEEFLNLDGSDFPITPETRKRFNKMLRQAKKKRITVWSVVKHTAVACLLIMSICFTACMCIPTVRNAIKEVFVEWYDEYIAISFAPVTPSAQNTELSGGIPSTDGINAIPHSPSSATDTSATPPDATDLPAEAATEAPTSPPLPTTIEKKAVATYLPDNYTFTVRLDNSEYYQLLYKLDNMPKFILMQKPINEYLTWIDSENQNVQKVYVNNYMGILTISETKENTYTLIWQTEEYEYQLSGTFENTKELIKIAEGIKTE